MSDNCSVCGTPMVGTCLCCGNTGVAAKVANMNEELARLRARVAELEESVRFNEGQRRMLFDSATTLEADRDRWKAVAEKRHAIIESLEWCQDSMDEEGTFRRCPTCSAFEPETHESDCAMAKAIAESAS